MIRDVSTSTLFTEFDNIFSVYLRFREPAPLPCKITSVCQDLFPENTFAPALVCVLWSFVVGRLRGGCCGPPHGLPCLGTGVPWVSLRGPTGEPQSLGRPCGKAPTLLGVVVGVLGVVTSCVPCARVPPVSRDVLTTGCGSCATENTYTGNDNIAELGAEAGTCCKLSSAEIFAIPRGVGLNCRPIK